MLTLKGEHFLFRQAPRIGHLDSSLERPFTTCGPTLVATSLSDDRDTLAGCSSDDPRGQTARRANGAEFFEQDEAYRLEPVRSIGLAEAVPERDRVDQRRISID